MTPGRILLMAALYVGMAAVILCAGMALGQANPIQGIPGA